MAIDPICEMTVDEASALHAERDGQTHYFCSEHCRREFLSASPSSEPSHRATAKVESSAAKPIYTCPMHPEVQQDHPGNCPKCGMTLELKTVTAGALYPFLGLLLSPIIAGAAMSLSSVSVIGNALRLRTVKL